MSRVTLIPIRMIPSARSACHNAAPPAAFPRKDNAVCRARGSLTRGARGHRESQTPVNHGEWNKSRVISRGAGTRRDAVEDLRCANLPQNHLAPRGLHGQPLTRVSRTREMTVHPDQIRARARGRFTMAVGSAPGVATPCFRWPSAPGPLAPAAFVHGRLG